MSWNVAGVMTHDVVAVDPTTPFKSCISTMRMHGVSALPVVDRGKLVGIVTVTDLMLKEFRPTVRQRYEGVTSADGELTAGSLMTRKVVTVAAADPVVTAVRLMFEHRVNRLPVVDGEGRLIGIVSRSDILRVFMRSDVAIRKEVADGVLSQVPLVGGGSVTPEVRNGVVTLEGEVDGGPLTQVLLRLVASVPGVVGVHNRLKVSTRVAAHHV